MAWTGRGGPLQRCDGVDALEDWPLAGGEEMLAAVGEQNTEMRRLEATRPSSSAWRAS